MFCEPARCRGTSPRVSKGSFLFLRISIEQRALPNGRATAPFPCVRPCLRWIVRLLFVVVESAAQVLLNLNRLLRSRIQKLLQAHNTGAHHTGLLLAPLLKLIFGF